MSLQQLIIFDRAVVKDPREGKTVFYSLADDHVRSIINQGMDHISE